MPLLETSKRQERDETKSETRQKLERDGVMADGLSQPNKISGERLERDVAMAEGLTQTNKIASKSWRELERDQRDMELWPMAYHSLTRQLERARERLERDGAMADGLSQPNKIARERWRYG